jgi:hypothetical protein
MSLLSCSVVLFCCPVSVERFLVFVSFRAGLLEVDWLVSCVLIDVIVSLDAVLFTILSSENFSFQSCYLRTSLFYRFT